MLIVSNSSNKTDLCYKNERNEQYLEISNSIYYLNDNLMHMPDMEEWKNTKRIKQFQFKKNT